MCAGLCSAYSSIEIVNYRYLARDRPGLEAATVYVISCFLPPPPSTVDRFKWSIQLHMAALSCSGNGRDGDVYFTNKLPSQAGHFRMVS
nr:hypothetical protein HmN_000457000 [Hymenolepis microstoma]